MLDSSEHALIADQAWSELVTIYNEAPVGLAVIDANFRFIRINARLAEINGIPAEDHIGRTIREVVPTLGDFGEDLVKRVIAGGKAIRNLEIEGETAAQPGRTRSFIEHWSPLKDASGRVVAVNVVVEEVTDRKEAVQRIAESERRLAAALRIGKLGVFEQTLLPHPVCYWDSLARRIWGISEEQEISDDLFWSLIHPDDLELVRAFRKSIDEATEPRRFDAEYRIFRLSNNAMRWVSVSLDLVFEDGKPHKLLGIVQDITDQKVAAERDQFLIREVNHRAKNLLAVVQAIAAQTSRNQKSADTFSREFANRLVSLSNSHDLVARSNWTGVSIAELVSSQLLHLKSLVGDRILMKGQQYLITPKAAQDIGMAIHELTTNAAKYGALSNSDGCVLIGWNVTSDDYPQFQMSWIELDGPAVSSAGEAGFGTLVITRMLETSLKATVSLQYQPSGLQWMLQAPADSVVCS